MPRKHIGTCMHALMAEPKALYIEIGGGEGDGGLYNTLTNYI